MVLSVCMLFGAPSPPPDTLGVVKANPQPHKTTACNAKPEPFYHSPGQIYGHSSTADCAVFFKL
jgi:hypothetical protein